MGSMDCAVKILGPLRVDKASGPVSVTAPKERAVLALLAVSAGSPVSVDRLVEELWPDYEPRRARVTLQVRISAIRKLLGGTDGRAGSDGLIQRSTDGYRLAIEPSDLDAWLFDEWVRTARLLATRGDHSGSGEVFEGALAMWRGSALADASLTPGLVSEALRLEELRISASEDWLDVDLARGRPGEVVARSEALIQANPFREGLWAASMLGLYRCGRQADALDAYQKVRHLLAEELGIEPGPRLRALESAILRHDPALDQDAVDDVGTAPGADRGPAIRHTPGRWVRSLRQPSGRSAVPAALHRARSTPLVGRSGELDRLGAEWERAALGNGGVVIVTGDAGIGKTRLVAELALRAHDAGSLVLLGRCDEDPLAAYQPFRQAVGWVVRSRPDVLDHVAAHDLESVSRLLPELRPADAPVPTDISDDERFTLFEAVTALLRSIAGQQPLLLLVDDVQWMDRASVELLHHVVAHPTSAPLLVALTSREEGPAAERRVAQLVAAAERAGRSATTIELSGLEEDELAAVAQAVVEEHHGAPLEPALVAALHRATRGNPFFARETIRHLLDTGDVSTSRVLAVPDSVRTVVDRRVEALPRPTAMVLEAASIVGQDFELDVVASALDRDVVSVLDDLDAAVDARLVLHVGDASSTFTFSHPVIRQCIEAGIPRARTRHLHRGIADHLERWGQGRDGGQIEVAFHLEAAGPLVESQRLHRCAVAAASYALSILAYEDACRLLEIALRTAGAAGLDQRSRVDLRIDLGEALVRSGNPEGRTVLAGVGELARRHGMTEQLARAAFAAGQESIAIAYHDPTLIRMLEVTLDELGQQDSALRARVLGRLGFELFPRDTTQKGAMLVDQAVAMARRIGDAATLAVVLSHRRFYHSGPVPTLVEDGREIVELATQAGEPGAALVGYVSLAGGLLQGGDVQGAERLVDLVAASATELRRPRMMWWAAHARGVLAGVFGDLDESDRLLAVALSLGERTGEVNAFGWYLCQMYPNEYLRGRLGSVAPMVDAYVEATPESIIARAAQPLVDCCAGEVDSAQARLDGFAADGFAGVRWDSTWFASMSALAEAVVALGRVDDAEVLLRRLAPHSGMVIDISCVSGCFGPMDRVLGALAETVGELDAAIAFYAAAVATCERISSRPWLALCEERLAGALERRGDPGDVDRVETLRTHARIVADESGVVLGS